jgi:hypothetical protein
MTHYNTGEKELSTEIFGSAQNNIYSKKPFLPIAAGRVFLIFDQF